MIMEPTIAAQSQKEGSQSIFCSPTFTFFVENDVFFVHTALIERVSKPLERLMRIGMAEKEQGFATLAGVSRATFERFLQWGYCGYYLVPHPVAEPQSLAEEKPKRPGKVVAVNVPMKKMEISKATKKEPKCPRMGATGACIRTKFVTQMPKIRRSSIEVPQPVPNTDAKTDYSQVLLAHAQLYIFADEKDVQELKILAVEELHAQLSVFTLHKNRVGDVLTLLAFAYENTYTNGDPLRNMLSLYMAMEAETLMEDEGFKALIFEDGGPIYDDFMHQLRGRML